MKKHKTTITNIEDVEKLLLSKDQSDKNVGKFLLDKADMSDPQTASEMQKLIDKVRPTAKYGVNGTLGYILVINDKELYHRNTGNSFTWQSKGSPKSNFTTHISYEWRYGNKDAEVYKIFGGDAKAYTKFLAAHGIIKTYELVYNASTHTINLKLCS